MSDHKAKITFQSVNGNVTWTVDPESLPVPHGREKTILWELTNQSTPGAKFPANGGIEFKGGNIWPGSVPARVSDTVYASVENNENPGPGPLKYPYTITVDLQGQQFQHDPDVNNDPPPPGPGGDGEGDDDDEQGGGGHDHEHGHEHGHPKTRA